MMTKETRKATITVKSVVFAELEAKKTFSIVIIVAAVSVLLSKIIMLASISDFSKTVVYV